jgi:hypothetical protein
MTDDELVAAFEACTLAGDEFHHSAHLRVAWVYLQRHPLPQAANRFCDRLERYARSLGAPGKYDSVLTRQWLLRISECLLRNGEALTFDDFRARHPGLF